MTREQALQLIERLGGINKNEHLCPDGECVIPHIFGEHELFIGDVLEKMQGKTNSFAKLNYEHDVEKLCEYWMPCKLSKSLQTILEESECEEIFVDCISDERFPKCQELHMYDHKQTMLTSPAKELFSFLDTLFTDK